MEDELILADLGVVERRLERHREGSRRRARRADLERERDAAAALQGRARERRSRCARWASPATTCKRLRGFQLLSAKPLLRRDQSRRSRRGDGGADVERGRRATGLARSCRAPATRAVAALREDRARDRRARCRPMPTAFLEDLGSSESGLDRVIRASYDLLGYMSFFTVGEDECRAWSIPRGTIAQRRGRRDPQRHRARLHPRRGRGLRRVHRARLDGTPAGSTASCASRARSTSCRTATSSTSGSPPRRRCTEVAEAGSARHVPAAPALAAEAPRRAASAPRTSEVGRSTAPSASQASGPTRLHHLAQTRGAWRLPVRLSVRCAAGLRRSAGPTRRAAAPGDRWPVSTRLPRAASARPTSPRRPADSRPRHCAAGRDWRCLSASAARRVRSSA